MDKMKEFNEIHQPSLDQLPHEIIHSIINYIHSPLDIQRLSLVNHRLRVIAREDFVWKSIVQKSLQ